MVFDNVDDFALIEEIMPRGDHGAIITTSRDSVRSEAWTCKGHQVLDFSISEGCDFLRASLSILYPAEEDRNLYEISKSVHGYPLALGQIAGFIRTYKCSMHDFWFLFRDKRRSAAISTYQLTAYRANLATVWDLSCSSLDKNSKIILEIFAFLDADSLPVKFFKQGAAGQEWDWPRLHFMTDPMSFMKALMKLRSQSLIRINDQSDTISIHRFFQDNIRELLHKQPSLYSRSFKEALHLLSKIQPKFMNQNQHWNPQHWAGSEQYLPHITSLEQHFLAQPHHLIRSAAVLANLVYHSAV